jgi:hypothetical protein
MLGKTLSLPDIIGSNDGLRQKVRGLGQPLIRHHVKRRLAAQRGKAASSVRWFDKRSLQIGFRQFHFHRLLGRRTGVLEIYLPELLFHITLTSRSLL